MGEARLYRARDSHTAGLQQGEERNERMKHGKDKVRKGKKGCGMEWKGKGNNNGG